MVNQISCKPGAFVEVVPLGLLCTLQYNSGGILQKIILGYNETSHVDADVLDSNLTLQLKQNLVVPQRIDFKKGTTWVKGVLYTQKLFKSQGTMPECLKEDMLADLKSHIEDYTFYAGHLKNDSFAFTGSSVITTRLSTFGFNVLPGYMVYDNLRVLPIAEMMTQRKSPFKFPYISGIMIYESVSEWKYVPAELSQYTVKSTLNKLDDHGYVHTILDIGSKKLNQSYTDIVQHDVQTGSSIIIDGETILDSRKYAFFKTKLSRSTQCSVCGKAMTVPVRGWTVCQDEHCVSRLYPRIRRFLNQLHLPEMPFEQFNQYVKDGEITCLIDVLILDDYRDLKVKCTLSTLISAMLPAEICRGSEFVQEFVNYLGSVEALDYYVQNPDAIVTDLNLNKLFSRNFATWLKDPSNVLELQTLLQSDQIEIETVRPKFEGSPIFRGKTICVTGKFRHGTLEDVISILKSYSANVITKFDNTVSCVVVGHYEQEDTNITDLATSYNVPIYSEDDFFKSYEIDLDIKKQRDSLSSYLN
jgi:hypothetical protein